MLTKFLIILLLRSFASTNFILSIFFSPLKQYYGDLEKKMEDTGQFLLWLGIALFLALAIADTGRQK